MKSKVLLKLKIWFLAAIALSCGNTLIGQEELSPGNAIATGLENNYEIRISSMDLEIAENNNAWGTAGAYPFISIGLNQRNRFDNSPDRIGDGERDKYFTNSVNPYVNLNWTLFDGFAVQITKDKLELLEEFTEGNATLVVENTIQSIILAYYKVLLEREKLDVLNELKNLSGDRYRYQLEKKKLGAAVTYDVLQAEDAFLSDSTNFLLQKLNLKNAMLNLKLLLGEESDVEYELTGNLETGLQEYSLDTLMNRMLENNTTLINQYINQEILRKEIAFRKSSLYPSLSLNAGADHFNTRQKYQDVSAAYSNSLDYYANFSLSFNLSNGGNVKRAIQNARIDEIIGELTIDQMKHGLTNQLKNYYDLYNIRKQLYRVSLVSVESAKLNLQISEEKFKSGAINSFNYRDVQLIYLNAAIGKLESIYNLIDTQTELQRLTGGIIQAY